MYKNVEKMGLVTITKQFWKSCLNLFRKRKENLFKEGNPERQCVVTGLDISMQRSNSFLLSHTGLKYYFKNDRELFNEIKNKYLTDHWKDASIKTQIKEIAHSIRGHYGSMKRHHEKLNDPSQYSLFD